MKILLLSEYFYPHWTGIARAFEALAVQLTEEGHSVTVLTTQFKKDLQREETHNKIHIVRSPYLFKISRTYYSIALLKDAISLCRNNNIVIINSPNSNILPLAILGKLMGKRVFIYHQGDLTLPRQTGPRVINSVLECIFDIMTIPAMALANGVSTYTADYAKNSRVMRFFMNKFHPYIPTLSLSTKKPDVQFQKKITGLKKEYKLVGFAGRFVEEKGFDILFRAIPQVIKEIPNTKFVFAGQIEIDYEPFFEKNKALIESVKEHVIFLGLLEEAELAEFYRNLDVFIISSRSDCFPLTQMEAARSGISVVVTDIPGARMLVKETGCGIIVKSEDPESLAKGIIEFLRDTSFWPSETRSRIFSKVTKFFKTYETFFLG